jgi:hypothetical protein
VLVRLGDGQDTAFVPLADATVESEAIRVAQPRERIEAAPRPEARETLSVADERRLYDHYGLAYSEGESDTVLPEGATTTSKPRLRRFEGTPPPIPLPEPPPRVVPPPPEQRPAAAQESRKPPVPIVLGAAIAALLALLVWRSRRR